MTPEAKEKLMSLLSALDKQIADICGSAHIMQNIVREVRKLVQL